MKIQCNYCGTFFDDTNAQCPFCGGKNEGVVRTTSSQPLTIEQLQEWYKSKGLPPYETTRFFIGIDYRKPKAFGIYKDQRTGNFVVYKNKASGERAVRYEGTDEAYAVNELFQRLKQEIIEQKRVNLEKNNYNHHKYNNFNANNKFNIKNSFKFAIKMILMIYFISFFLHILIIIGTFFSDDVKNFFADKPDAGYYSYNNTTYYYFKDDSSYNDHSNWFSYIDNEKKWSDPINETNIPKNLKKNKNAKKFFLSEYWTNTYKCTDFTDSLYYKDSLNNFSVSSGYYTYNNNVYYHLTSDYDNDWYIYDNNRDWVSVYKNDIPYELQHESLAEDFYNTYTWDSSTQTTDFYDSNAYKDYKAEQERIAEENNNNNWDNDDNDYDWDSNDSWDSGGTDWDSDW